MKELIKIVRKGNEVRFFDSEGAELSGDMEIMGALLYYIEGQKRDGSYILSAMPERGFNMANQVVRDEERRSGLDYEKL